MMAKTTTQTASQLDSGATVTISNDRRAFSNINPATRRTIQIAVGSVVPATGEGNYHLQTQFVNFKLRESLYVKDLDETLISVRQMLENTKNKIIFTADDAKYYVHETKKIYPLAKIFNKVYTLLPPNQITVPTEIAISTRWVPNQILTQIQSQNQHPLCTLRLKIEC
jgi:hypothetical protein